MQLDEDSASVMVEMPKEERQRIALMIHNWQYDIRADQPHHLNLYFCASEVYIRNLIARREQPKHIDEYKRKFTPGTIVYQPVQCSIKEPNGKEELAIQVQGQLCLIYTQYKGLEINLKLAGIQFKLADYLAVRFHLGAAPGEDPRTKTQQFTLNGQNLSYLIPQQDFDTYFKSRLAFEVIIQREKINQSKFAGIINECSCCYMNSILQVLYFIRVLRKSVVNFDGNGKIINALKEVFLCLVYNPHINQGPVDPELLIQAFGRFAEEPRRQQDTQEFLLGFLEELESENATLAQLWQGECIQVLQSIEEDKPYTSRVKEDFSGLELPLEDLKGNTFAHLIQAVRHLLDKQKVEDKIDSDDYGKITVQKSRQFTKLPPVLFLTLKRYKFKKGNQRPTKILADLHYPQKINFGFLLGTATGDDMDYILFAVTVHRGQLYSSGHYYSFINTSTDENQPYWVRFDDTRVTLASTAQALSFSGGKRRMMFWDKEYQKFREKEYLAEDTGYVLIYFRKQVFREYQSAQTLLTKALLAQRQKPRVQMKSSKQEMLEVAVLVGKLDKDFNPFGDVPTFPVSLHPDEDVVTQLSQLDYSLLGCKVGTVWKISKDVKKMKQIVQYADLVQTASRLLNYKPGHRIPDYLLILPATTPIYEHIECLSQNKNYGMVRVTFLQEKTNTLKTHAWKLIQKNSLEEFINVEENDTRMKAHVLEKEEFMYDWNDLCTLVLE